MLCHLGILEGSSLKILGSSLLNSHLPLFCYWQYICKLSTVSVLLSCMLLGAGMLKALVYKAVRIGAQTHFDR